MSAKTNHERMLELIEKLTKADLAYYRDDNPIMSDRDYDILMDELKDIESRTGLILSGSPTQKGIRRNSERSYRGTSYQTYAFGR